VSSDELIAEAGRRIAEQAPGARVIVFGSHARGSATDRSDLDLLVVEAKVEDPAAEWLRLRRALLDLPTAIDLVVVSEEYADEWREVHGSLVHAALAEGRVVTG
jgi:predicted nucleotidyltransferase